jgi:MFS transporter, ACS family, glucarate transporter
MNSHILSVRSQVAEQAPPAASPTHIRYYIVGLLAVVLALTYLDRLNLSIAGKYIQDEFALSTETVGWILSGFGCGYALFQIAGGWLGDRYGPRRVLALAILWWSVFTAGTAIAPRLPLAAWLGFPGSFSILRFIGRHGRGVDVSQR